MRRASIFIAIIVITLAISVPLSIPVFAQEAGPQNPNANVTTAYSLLRYASFFRVGRNREHEPRGIPLRLV